MPVTHSSEEDRGTNQLAARYDALKEELQDARDQIDQWKTKAAEAAADGDPQVSDLRQQLQDMEREKSTVEASLREAFDRLTQETKLTEEENHRLLKLYEDAKAERTLQDQEKRRLQQEVTDKNHWIQQYQSDLNDMIAQKWDSYQAYVNNLEAAGTPLNQISTPTEWLRLNNELQSQQLRGAPNPQPLPTTSHPPQTTPAGPALGGNLPAAADNLPDWAIGLIQTLALNQAGQSKPSFPATSRTKEHESAKLTEVDATKWIMFRDNFETTLKLNKWDDERAKLKLRAAVRDEAKQAVHHIVMLDSWDIARALDEYQKVFVHPAATDLAEVELQRASRKPEETLLDFHTRLRFLFSRARPTEEAESSKVLKDLYATRVNSLNLSKELRATGQIRQETYQQLLARAQDVEAGFKTVQDAYKGHRGLHAMQLYDEEFAVGAVGALTETRTCYACQETGHIARDCKTAQRVREHDAKANQGGGSNRGKTSSGRGRGGKKWGGNRSGGKTSTSSQPKVSALEDRDDESSGNE